MRGMTPRGYVIQKGRYQGGCTTIALVRLLYDIELPHNISTEKIHFRGILGSVFLFLFFGLAIYLQVQIGVPGNMNQILWQTEFLRGGGSEGEREQVAHERISCRFVVGRRSYI